MVELVWCLSELWICYCREAIVVRYRPNRGGREGVVGRRGSGARKADCSWTVFTNDARQSWCREVEGEASVDWVRFKSHSSAHKKRNGATFGAAFLASIAKEDGACTEASGAGHGSYNAAFSVVELCPCAFRPWWVPRCRQERLTTGTTRQEQRDTIVFRI